MGKLGNKFPECFRGGNEAVGRFAAGSGSRYFPLKRHDFVGKGSEVEFAEHGGQSLGIDAFRTASLPIDGYGHVGIKADEFTTELSQLDIFVESLTSLGAKSVAPGLNGGVKGVVFQQELLGETRAEARNSGDIVRTVARDRLKIDDLVGPDAPVLFQRLGVKDQILADVVESHLVG